jgi:hypothetical protein
MAAPAAAFYPFFMPNAAPPTPTPAVRSRLTRVKRSNQFAIIQAEQPTTPNSVGVDQDGHDYSYMIKMEFGSDKTTLEMLMDTAAVNTWVMASSCTMPACAVHNTFGPDDSTTLQTTANDFAVYYGSGSVSGSVASDTVTFLGKALPLGFGLATNVSEEFNSFPMDGIVGLGRLQNVADNAEGVKAPTLVDVLVAQGVISAKVIGIHLSGGADPNNDGEITFGAADTSLIDGDLSYVAAINNADGFWEIPVGGASVGGKPAAIQTGVTAILDSGTSFMLLPPADADALNLQIPGAVANGETYLIPCGSNTPVVLTLAGRQWPIDPKNYVGNPSGNACQSNIVSHLTFGATQWLLGETFLKNVYTLFDNDGARVGFGNLKSEFLSLPVRDHY